ncbi:ImmA/IrrE family metallo-endopeptidase [Massilia putida]|uniref:ImmA/IrrE family metallo-endopeptidase n=1 Tax=Massilia putida TaxID=1141883 RepID=UPI001E3C9DE2|nr:ImmA/IrrE family metallo-endopeptidase [Massilia putida]
MAEANRISKMLNAVLGTERFPVKVDELALEYSRQCFAASPIDKVQGEDLDGFDGMLAANKSRSKWLILYNSATASEGRKRFTIAHEFGHYLLHRHQQDRFECGGDDIETGDNNGRDIEAESDSFASTLLMPLDDFRRQVDGQPISFDLLGHCADRYGVSLTAAALRWTEIAPKRAVLVASRDDHMLWAKSNEAALRSGAYFATRKNTIELPRQALAHSYNGWDAGDQQTGRAQDWFPREPGSMPVTEMTRVAGQYDYTLTLLLMPDAEWQRPRHDDEEAEEDTFDRFIRNGQYPAR